MKNLLIAGLMSCCLALAGNPALADCQRSTSTEGASISFADLADGDVVPPGLADYAHVPYDPPVLSEVVSIVVSAEEQ